MKNSTPKLTISSDRRWEGQTAIVIATGPSLDFETAQMCSAYKGPKIGVNDAYVMVPNVDIVYAADDTWWARHSGLKASKAELWSVHELPNVDKTPLIKAIPRMKLIAGRVHKGFSADPAVIHYGENSGFQAVNLALLFGASKVLLVGFNMQLVKGVRHFFGDHPWPAVNTESYGYDRFLQHFDAAKDTVPPGVEIVNCTPNSRLTCFRPSTLKLELPQ